MSLKYDPSLNPYPLNNKVNLIYCIKSRELFENAVSLLNGLTSEIIPNRMYSTYDPDGNQIFLIDASKLTANENILKSTCFSDYLKNLNFKNNNSTYISSLSSLSLNQSNKPTITHSPSDSYFSNTSPNSNSSNSVRTTVISSINIPIENLTSVDSGRCSAISFSNEYNNMKSSRSSTDCSSFFKNLSVNEQDERDVSKLLKDKKNVKNLIQKFNNDEQQNIRVTKNKQLEFAKINNVNVQTYYPTSLVDSYSRSKVMNSHVAQSKRPVSSLGNYLNESIIYQNCRLERPKSCTSFNTGIQGKQFENNYCNSSNSSSNGK